MPRADRYRLVPTSMNGQPAALAYMRGEDGRYSAACMTVLTVDPDGRISELTVFVPSAQVAAWGHPAVLE